METQNLLNRLNEIEEELKKLKNEEKTIKEKLIKKAKEN